MYSSHNPHRAQKCGTTFPLHFCLSLKPPKGSSLHGDDCQREAEEREIPKTLTFVSVPKQDRKSLNIMFASGMDSLERILSGNDKVICSAQIDRELALPACHSD